MLFINRLIYTLAFAALVMACNNSDNSTAKESIPVENKTSNPVDDLKVGGLYIIKDNDSSYSVCKILALDDFAVHLRSYKEEFKTAPAKLSSSDLTVMIGHAPIDKTGFIQSQPTLLAIEEVKESELEGYKIYLEAMK
jgi:hypothetical protein